MKTFITRLLSTCNLKKTSITSLLFIAVCSTQHAFVQAPANDNCTGAVAFPAIPVDQSCALVTVNTAGATESIPTENASLGDADDDVWYTFVCPADYTSLRYTYSNLPNSIVDVMLEFYSNTCNNLISESVFDPEEGTVSNLIPGNTYYVRVYTFNGSTSTSGFLCLRVPPPPPVNDDCAGAIAFPAIPTDQSCVSVVANTDMATQSMPDACFGSADDDVWYSFVCPAGYTSLRYDMSTISGSTEKVIEFFSGTCDNLISKGCNISSSGFIPDLTPGETYYFRVFSYYYPDFTETSICLHVPPPPPANDECANATAFPTIPADQTCVSVDANTDAATRSMANCNGEADDDIWYSFVCPVGENKIRYQTTYIEGNGNRVIEFFSGTCGNLASFGCSSDNEGTISGLTGGATYYFRIYTYDPNEFTHASICLKTLPPPASNDEAVNAIELTVGAGCPGTLYSNYGGTQSTGEPFPNITGTQGYGTTWFKFTAPASGMVKITDDYTSGTAGGDSRLGLFSATNAADYSTFTTLAGDNNNGISNYQRAAIFMTGLTAGTTYYIAHDAATPSTEQGTFCITVDEITPTMLARFEECEQGSSFSVGSTFTGWRSMVDPSGRLIAIIKQNNINSIQASVTVDTVPVRTSPGGVSYLERNYNFSSFTSVPADIQLFLKDTEIDAFNTAMAASGGLPITLNNLRVIAQERYCSHDYDDLNNAGSILTPTAVNAANGVSFVALDQLDISSYTNFFLTFDNNPLPLKLISFNGKNDGAVNTLNWQTVDEKNFSHFELQRSSNGSDFSKLDIIAGKNMATGSKYQYNDIRPLEGKNFYRLLMIDANGKTGLSNVVELTSHTGSGIDVMVHPNPVKASMQINITGKPDGNANILVMDIMGKILKTIQPKSSNISVDMNAMPAGTYVVKYVDNSHTIVTKVIKE